MFVVVEGIDLVGKTLQHDLLVQHLRGLGRDVAEFSFPAYDSPTGRVISDHLRRRSVLIDVCAGESCNSSTLIRRSARDDLVFQCLQVVDKYAAAPEIARHLREGRDVVSCRWWQSAYAYWMDTGADADWNRKICECLPRADVNILLDLDPREARRRPGEGLDRLEADLSRQGRIRQSYLDLWMGRLGQQGGFWGVVDAGGEPGDVHERILLALECAGISRSGGG